MKNIILITITLICITIISYLESINNINNNIEERYKRALDVACYSAMRASIYKSDNLYDLSNGLSDSINIDKEKALEWFYKVLFKNLNIEDNKLKNNLKKYIPIKCILGYEKMYLANKEDKWISIPYIFKYNNSIYKLTLDCKVYKKYKDKYIETNDIKNSYKYLINIIKSNINNIMDNETNSLNIKYNIKFGVDKEDENMCIKGISFIAFVDNMPISKYDFGKKFYAVSFAGSEILRNID